MKPIFFILFAYLIGSINFAVITSRLSNKPDPRTQGSGNPGFTNMLRTSSKWLALFVLVGDAIKGALPVLLAYHFNVDSSLLSLIALLAVIGHMYPIYFSFRGGKGVATTLGAIIALSWPVGLALLITWVTVALLFRYSSLASLSSIVLLPVYIVLFANREFILPMLLLTVLVIFRHRLNIKRLLKGDETKLSL